MAKERFGTSTRSFWDPGCEPEADKTAFKIKDVDRVCDPTTGSVLKLKKLFSIKFTPIDKKMSDAKRQAIKARWKVSIHTFIFIILISTELYYYMIIPTVYVIIIITTV